MDRVLDRIGKGYRFNVMGGLNGLLGYRVREDITAFGVAGENENVGQERRMMHDINE